MIWSSILSTFISSAGCHHAGRIFCKITKTWKLQSVVSPPPENVSTPVMSNPRPARGPVNFSSLCMYSKATAWLYFYKFKHKRTQGSLGSHTPQISIISCHFVLWEVVSQTKHCFSPKVKRFAPPQNFGLATPLISNSTFLMQWSSVVVHDLPRTGRFPLVQCRLGAKLISSFRIFTHVFLCSKPISSHLASHVLPLVQNLPMAGFFEENVTYPVWTCGPKNFRRDFRPAGFVD